MHNWRLLREGVGLCFHWLPPTYARFRRHGSRLCRQPGRMAGLPRLQLSLVEDGCALLLFTW